MAGDKALWRRAFDTVEGALAPRAEAAVRCGEFAAGLSQLKRVRSGLLQALDSRTRSLWHVLNLPAGSDVHTMRRQLGELDREVRLLRSELDRARREAATAGPPKQKRPAAKEARRGDPGG